MQQWKMFMAQGNSSYSQQLWIDAEQSYYQAVDMIETLWESDVENIELLLAWVAGQHNLSTLFEQQGLECEAMRYLVIPHQRILQLMHHSSPDGDFHQTLFRAAKVTLTPLLEYSTRHDICDECLASLQISREWLTTPKQQLH